MNALSSSSSSSSSSSQPVTCTLFPNWISVRHTFVSLLLLFAFNAACYPPKLHLPFFSFNRSWWWWKWSNQRVLVSNRHSHQTHYVHTCLPDAVGTGVAVIVTCSGPHSHSTIVRIICQFLALELFVGWICPKYSIFLLLSCSTRTDSCVFTVWEAKQTRGDLVSLSETMFTFDMKECSNWHSTHTATDQPASSPWNQTCHCTDDVGELTYAHRSHLIAILIVRPFRFITFAQHTLLIWHANLTCPKGLVGTLDRFAV